MFLEVCLHNSLPPISDAWLQVGMRKRETSITRLSSSCLCPLINSLIPMDIAMRRHPTQLSSYVLSANLKPPLPLDVMFMLLIACKLLRERNILQQSDSYDLKSVWLLHGWHVTAVKIKAAEERLPAAVFILVTAAKPTPFSDFEPSVYNTSDPWYLELCWKNL